MDAYDAYTLLAYICFVISAGCFISAILQFFNLLKNKETCYEDRRQRS